MCGCDIHRLKTYSFNLLQFIRALVVGLYSPGDHIACTLLTMTYNILGNNVAGRDSRLIVS